MTNPTSNFGWQMPTSTDLVTDLPADFETFGQAVDTSLADLKGGTTGQVLSKASNTDMDFTWVAQDDSNAIQNAIVDAKGDLIAASAADTPARLGVGTNGQVLTADSSAATGLKWATPTAGFSGVGLTKSAAQSIANATYTAISWDGESFDTDAFHDNSTNNSRVTIPSGKAGKYLFTGIVNFAVDNTAGNLRLVNIYVNGSATGDIIFLTNPSGSTSVTFSKVISLSVSDYVQIFAYQNCGGSLEIKGTPLFGTGLQVTYLGA